MTSNSADVLAEARIMNVTHSLDELDGSDFQAIRGHSAVLRAEIERLRAALQQSRSEGESK